ncbi:ATP-binding protein [Dyadobacter sp. CY261]|uniref:sensor histidine kinase n=1 Tax=Dyadobacter sp. CY261 TaxID=2907203 RepID=UPI001F2B2415|nr:ATP-binding protein [Dyadobacter sp. CY261]MCF0073007.1 ATP-binding protein [Dyadobacter sp. CY261]
MHLITKLNLDNDLDLMLAHKRSMQVAEYGGVGLVHQTSFATAVSEVCRLMLDKGTMPHLFLGFLKNQSGRNSVCARVVDESISAVEPDNPNLTYARRLVSGFFVEAEAITLLCDLPVAIRLSREIILRGQKLFEELPAVTPYEEAKRLNVQLQEMATRLRESERKYQVLTDAVPLMMFTLDQEGQLLFANEGFRQFAGTALQPGKVLNWINWLSECESSVAAGEIRDRLKAKEEFSIEACIKRKADGTRLWHLLSMTPTESAVTSSVEWSGFLVNIQAQKLVEATLRDNAELKYTKQVLEKRQMELDATIADLNRSNQELARFAYVASHDLQEPARKMIVFSEMMLGRFQHLLPAEGINFLTRIKAASERMVAVIRDLLDYSRISAGEQVEMELVVFSEIIQHIEEHFDEQISESGAEIRQMGNAFLQGNKRLLTLLFQNLVGNGLKFVGAGVKPVISVNIRTLAKDEQLPECDERTEWVRVDVTDNGIGFDEQYFDKIFQMFQRLHTQEQFKGTGIGLAICKRIIEMHQGHIRVKSQVNGGSVFSIYLPYRQS